MAVLGLYGGSGKAGDMDYSPLRGRDVIYWPDNDGPGFKAALSLAGKIRGIAASVKIVRPPADAIETWDAADAIEKDGWGFDKIRDWISVNRLDPDEFEKLAGRAGDMPRQGERAPLRAYNIAEFIEMEIEPRKAILNPIIWEKGHAMLYAARGTGKTFVALSIAWTVASGGKLFDRWEAPEPRRVLLVDGEMPAISLQERLIAIGRASETDITRLENLVILSADKQDYGIPNLATDEGQKAIEPLVDQADLIILDNLSTLYSYGKSNDAESWLPMQQWLLKLRRKSKTVLIIHHANKSGDQRGTGAREDIVETCIKLQQPVDYEDKEGARFEVYYTKHRNFYGKEAEPFEAWLSVDSRGRRKWNTRTIEDARIKQVMELIDQGYKIRECEKELGIPRSTIHRLKKEGEKRKRKRD